MSLVLGPEILFPTDLHILRFGSDFQLPQLSQWSSDACLPSGPGHLGVCTHSLPPVAISGIHVGMLLEFMGSPCTPGSPKHLTAPAGVTEAYSM